MPQGNTFPRHDFFAVRTAAAERLRTHEVERRHRRRASRDTRRTQAFFTSRSHRLVGQRARQFAGSRRAQLLERWTGWRSGPSSSIWRVPLAAALGRQCRCRLVRERRHWRVKAPASSTQNHRIGVDVPVVVRLSQFAGCHAHGFAFRDARQTRRKILFFSSVRTKSQIR